VKMIRRQTTEEMIKQLRERINQMK
jgi:hypothetical protein